MPNRLDERRRRDREILSLGVAVAAGLHVVAFVFLPGLPESEVAPAEIEVDRAEVVGGRAIPLDVFFGPPTIEDARGDAYLEPPTRVLSTQRAVFLPASCRVRVEGANEIFTGSVRLEVTASGRVEGLAVEQSTGARCADDVLVRVAGDLWYRWLPSDAFPAPVRVTQPMTFVEIADL
jgi:hypothetical protein